MKLGLSSIYGWRNWNSEKLDNFLKINPVSCDWQSWNLNEVHLILKTQILLTTGAWQPQPDPPFSQTLQRNLAKTLMPSFTTFSPTPHPICQEILLAVPLNYTHNPTIAHPVYCLHCGPGHHNFLPGLVTGLLSCLPVSASQCRSQGDFSKSAGHFSP